MRIAEERTATLAAESALNGEPFEIKFVCDTPNALFWCPRHKLKVIGIKRCQEVPASKTVGRVENTTSEVRKADCSKWLWKTQLDYWVVNIKISCSSRREHEIRIELNGSSCYSFHDRIRTTSEKENQNKSNLNRRQWLVTQECKNKVRSFGDDDSLKNTVIPKRIGEALMLMMLHRPVDFCCISRGGQLLGLMR